MRVNDLTGVNKAKYRAQCIEEEAVDMLRDIMTGIETPLSLRRECALDIIRVARGEPGRLPDDARTVEVEAVGGSGQKVGDEINAARVSAALFARLDSLVRNRISYNEWPDEIKRLSEAAAFAPDEDSETA
jgi:hypothetical protein